MNHPRLNSLKHSHYGFSLVEMLIVVALIALLVAMITPSFAKMRRTTTVTNASTTLNSGLVQARMIAMRVGRPVIIKVNITLTNMTFTACLDANSTTMVGVTSMAGADDKGAAGNTAGSGNCTNGGGAGDTPLTGKQNPFFPLTTLRINNGVQTANDVSLGYPALTGATFTNVPSNFSAATGNFWFGYDTSGKLIPDGKSPYLAAQDITALPRYPASQVYANGAAVNAGGPEFYFAEFNALANNVQPGRHVFRKVSIAAIGGAQVMSWNTKQTPNAWLGIN